MKYILISIHPHATEKTEKIISELGEITSKITGASCGPMQILTFDSEKEREEIAQLLKRIDNQYDFFLFKKEDAEINMPDIFNEAIKDKKDRKENKKLSYQEQLDEAVLAENFELASILKKKISKKK